MNHDNTDANGWRHRSGGSHNIGESMPGTIGDAERVLHDRDGQTPTVDPSVEVPAEESETCTDTTEDNGVDVNDLVSRLRE